MMTHWEVCARMHDRWQIRNNLRLPEWCGCGQAHKERPTAANRLSSTGPLPTDQNPLFVSKSRSGPPRLVQKQITVGAPRI
jgi:hypothetical protein